MDNNKRNNIIKAIAAGAVYAVFFKLTAMLFSGVFSDSPYNGIIARNIDIAFLLIIIFALHRNDIFKNKAKGFFSTFAVAGVEIGVIALGLLQFVFSFTDPQDVSKFMSGRRCKECTCTCIKYSYNDNRNAACGHFRRAYRPWTCAQFCA